MDQKRSAIIAVIVMILGALLIAGVALYSHIHESNSPLYFHPDKKGLAERYYSEVMDRDMVGDYPASPESVMEMFCATVFLLYGDMIIDDEILRNVSDKQRNFYSNEILAAYTADEQFENLKSALATLYANQVVTLNLEQKPPLYSQYDNRTCTVRLIQYCSNMEPVYWSYLLHRFPEDERWRIVRREVTDQQFSPLE